MQPTHAIATALEKIAKLLRQENYLKQAIDIEALRDLALSDDDQDQARFRSEIAENKWYWLGQSTIADISFTNRELDGRFKRAYYELAMACDANGLGSAYSRDVATIFGQWIRDGVV